MRHRAAKVDAAVALQRLEVVLQALEVQPVDVDVAEVELARREVGDNAADQARQRVLLGLRDGPARDRGRGIFRKAPKPYLWVCGWRPYVKPCLLYTSPSPRDKRQSRMPSSA